MIKPLYPWPVPPRAPTTNGYREKPYYCHNCDDRENLLSVGTWLSEEPVSDHDNLVLCKSCFNRLNNQIIGRDFVKSLGTRLKILFTGRLK